MAAHEARLALQVWPGNVSLAEDLVPLFEAAGCHSVAEDLFAGSYELLRSICRDFPDSATHHNNLAWMAARCDRQLEEALKHALQATRLAGDNPAYLDTLAEVHFRLGDVSEAIRCAERCVELDPEKRHFQQQLERFVAHKTGKP
jgi:tetratricopeptide (TPR) repeat protein